MAKDPDAEPEGQNGEEDIQQEGDRDVDTELEGERGNGRS